ncbi:UNVERIFIED_CONTAM: hypothetical protein Slati_1012600 [Sesamum latifolium]|uniref:GRF-type domain-containing protein n=1 Tax=Sesamum latifolium TaxID=2727402 RepID=A0AAW2XUG2_9LAMI
MGSQLIYGFNHRNRSASPYDLLRICTCGKEVVVRTSWTTTNPGRRFRGCPGNEVGCCSLYAVVVYEIGQYCRSFQWVDPPMCRRSKEIIPGLLNRLSQYETTVKCAKERLEIEQTRRRRSTRLLFIALVCWAITLSLAIGASSVRTT